MDFADFDEAWNTFCHQTMGLPPNVGQDVDFCELVMPPLAESESDDDKAESISSDEDPFVFFGNSLPSGFYHVKPDQPLPPNDNGGFVFDELFGMCATPVPVAAASPRRGGKKMPGSHLQIAAENCVLLNRVAVMLAAKKIV